MNDPQLHYEEGDKCPNHHCSGTLEFLPSKSCSCHISPPCSSCTDIPLTCSECKWTAPIIENEESTRPVSPDISERYFKRPSEDLGNGKRIFDYDYDSSSGSTMVYSGRYEGPVTAKDILDYFGDGTFGHRGPSLHNGRFSYTKITD